MQLIQRTLVALFAAATVAGCANMSMQGDGAGPSLSYSEAQSRYQAGLTAYRESRFDSAAADLAQAVGSGQLSKGDMMNARKHLAFVHCAGGRELPCREQFQAMLKEDPDFNLNASEISHPQWGPVWRSVKGALDEKRALSEASRANATPAQQKLAEGIKEYDAGRYKYALDNIQAALKLGLPGTADELRARKYAAFTYCITQRTRQCRAEFKQIFSKEPGFELLPSEGGHPAWASIYRAEKSAAVKKADAAKKAEEAKKAAEAKKADSARKTAKK